MCRKYIFYNSLKTARPDRRPRNSIPSVAKRRRSRSRGFGLLEAVVAIALLMAVAAGLIGAGRLSVRSSTESLFRAQAAFLLEEGIEASRIIRDNGWTEFSALATDTPLQLFFSGAAWSATTAPQLIDGRFVRTITFAPARRDEADNISEDGVPDPDTKKVTVAVSWAARGATSSVSATTYLANVFGE